MKRGGFSIIEIVITITVLGILLSLGVVAMNSSQVAARDAERKADVEAIAMSFEGYYKNSMGSGESDTGGTSPFFMSGGTYPGTGYMYNAGLKIIAPEADPKIFNAPGSTNTLSVVSATNAVQTTSGVLPQPTTSTYVYQAIDQNGTGICDDPVIDGLCRKFNIFYRLEKDNSVQMVTSRNQ